jgi:hypothetical protein
MAKTGEVLFEFLRIGNTMKVIAFDVDSGTEISIVGPANYGPEILKRNALKRLEYVLKKEREGWGG